MTESSDSEAAASASSTTVKREFMLNTISSPVDGVGEDRTKRSRSVLWWIGRGAGVLVLGLVAVFVWGYFQPKPQGFAPTGLGDGAVVTDGWTQYTIDATSREEWVFFDLVRGRTIEATFAGSNWTLAFRRTDLRTNSGVTNSTGLGGAINLGESSLGDVNVPVEGVFIVDHNGEDDPDEVTNPAVSDWYNYNFITHTVHAGADTYLVRSGEGHDAFVQFDSYYCDDESPGCITIRYRLVPSGEAP